MRIPFPERVPINRVAIFAVSLFAIQRYEGTPLYFCTGCLAFILIAAFAFNTAGGLTRASGAYVFFYSVLVVIVGICYKAFLGEPANSNLADPLRDIEVYVGGITAMLAAVVVSRRFSRKTGLLQNVLKESQMFRASVGCIVFGFVTPMLISLLGDSAVRLLTAFGQLNQLMVLGIIIGVMYEIRRSGGTRSLNLFIVLGAAVYFFEGVLNFSKQGMLTPFYAWLVPVCALRFRLTVGQMATCLLAVFIMFYYLVPYSQYGRSFVEEGQTFNQRLDISASLLENPGDTRRAFYEQAAAQPIGALGEYYNTPQGFWDRLQFIAADDSLVNVTDQGKVFGIAPLEAETLNTIPHFLWRDKPELNFGMMYVHEIMNIPVDMGDLSTGISFSPTAEAYHMARWVGVLVFAPLLWFLLFLLYDSLFGDLRATPWGLLAVALISHAAPETQLTGVIHLITFGTEILVFCALFATWVAPVLASTVIGPDRQPEAPRTAPQPAQST